MLSPGGKQRAKTQAAKAHKPDLAKYYNKVVEDLDFNSLEYRTTLLRPKGVKPHRADIDRLIASIDWRYDEGDPVMHGAVALVPKDQWGGASIQEGDVLMLSVKWFGKWTEVWRMVLTEPNDSLSGGAGFDLEDPLYILQLSTDDWHYVKSKKAGHPNGWLCHEIVKDVARRYGLRLGKIAKGTRRIHSLTYDDQSPLAIIQRAYALEKASTGHRFVIRWDAGKLNVVPMRRNPLLYVLSGQIEDAVLGLEEKNSGFATAGTVRATVKDGKKHRKIVVKAQNAQAVRRYGFIHRNVTLGDVKDEGDATEKLKRQLNKVSQRKRTVTGIQHPLIPFIRRGDAIRVSIPSRGMSGDKAICFVSSGSWNLTGGVGTMTLDVTFDDPYVTSTAARKAKDKKARAKKRVAKKKKAKK
jgi:hypothetical protein